jgi:hypothetical protein
MLYRWHINAAPHGRVNALFSTKKHRAGATLAEIALRKIDTIIPSIQVEF